jgi:putative tryptophan/tyrosine transport system substrate-binding protein
MRRRDFLTLLGGAAAAWPFAARAQQDGRMRRVGVLFSFGEADQEAQVRFQVFRLGLADLGWVESRNLRLDVRWGEPDAARLRSLARELVALAPEVILTTSTANTQAARDATQSIPLVFVTLSDPVTSGVVTNQARPEANVTGFMGYEYSLAGKWLNLLKDIAPRLGRVALLFHADVAAPYASYYVRAAQEAGERLAVKAMAAPVRDAAGIEVAIAGIAGSNDGGLIVVPGIRDIPAIIALAAKYRAPAIYPARPYAAEGGLMSYGPDTRAQYHDGATYVDRILRGAKVSELPVQFATKFELVINLKTAKALGLDVTQQLQLSADEVIE